MKENSLLLQCIQAVGHNSSIYPDDVFEDLPRVLLTAISPFLSGSRLLRLNDVFVKKKISTSQTWMSHFEYRWRQCENSPSLFVSEQTTPLKLYMNKHFQEVFYHAVEGRWDDALYIDAKMNQCCHQTVENSAFQLGQVIPLVLKRDLVNNLEYYSQFIDRHSVYCAHIVRVLQHGAWLSLLTGIRAIRLTMLTDNNLEATLKLLHHLRRYGHLREINVSTCRLSSELSTKFVNFCVQVNADNKFNLYSPVQHLNYALVDSDLEDFGLDFGESEHLCSKRRKISTDKPDHDHSFGTTCSCDEVCDYGCDDNNLYDTALLEPLSVCLPKREKLPLVDKDELHLILQDVQASFVEKSCYSDISCLSIYDNDHSNNIIPLLLEVCLPCWTHLTALAVEELQNKAGSKTSCVLFCGIRRLFEYPCFQELQVTHSSILCILLALVNAKRNKPLIFLKLEHDKSSEPCHCEQKRNMEHDWTSCCCVQNLSLTYYNGHLYISILQQLITYDTALQHLSAHYTGFVSTPHDLDIGHILRASQDRENAGNPGLHSVNLSRACRITANPDYFTSSLSPVKIASLTSLTLNACRLYLMNGLSGTFTDDIVNHPNLRELDLSSNRLQKTGCNLLMKICQAIVDGGSKLKTVDFSCNDMTARNLLPVAQRVGALVTERQSETYQGSFGHRLILNMNHLGTECSKVQSLFTKLFLHRVEVKSYDCDVYFTPNADHISQM